MSSHARRGNSRKRLPQREILQCLVGEGSKSESMSSRVNRSSIFLWIRNEWFRQFIMMIMCFVPIKLLVDVDSQPCPNPFKTIILAQSSLRSPGRMALARRPAIFSRPRDASAEWVKAARVIMGHQWPKIMHVFYRKTLANQFFCPKYPGVRLHIFLFKRASICSIYMCVCVYLFVCI